MKKSTILDTVKSIEFDTNKKHIFGIKSGILWGHSNKSNSISPLLYISKPKSVSQEDFEYMLDCLCISMFKK